MRDRERIGVLPLLLLLCFTTAAEQPADPFLLQCLPLSSLSLPSPHCVTRVRVRERETVQTLLPSEEDEPMNEYSHSSSCFRSLTSSLSYAHTRTVSDMVAGYTTHRYGSGKLGFLRPPHNHYLDRRRQKQLCTFAFPSV